MTLGFGHLVGAWLPAKVVEYYRKKPFSQVILAALLVGAILPDADFFLEWLHIIPEIHRTITHSFIGVFAVSLLTYGLAHALKKYLPKSTKPGHLALAIGLGVCSHMFYDSLVYPGINALWPSDLWISSGALYTAKQSLYERVGRLSSQNKTHLFILDMGLGVAWMAYFWIKGRLKL